MDRTSKWLALEIHLRRLPVSHLRCISRANLRFKKFAVVVPARSLNARASIHR